MKIKLFFAVGLVLAALGMLVFAASAQTPTPTFPVVHTPTPFSTYTPTITPYPENPDIPGCPLPTFLYNRSWYDLRYKSECSHCFPSATLDPSRAYQFTPIVLTPWPTKTGTSSAAVPTETLTLTPSPTGPTPTPVLNFYLGLDKIGQFNDLNLIGSAKVETWPYDPGVFVGMFFDSWDPHYSGYREPYLRIEGAGKAQTMMFSSNAVQTNVCWIINPPSGYTYSQIYDSLGCTGISYSNIWTIQTATNQHGALYGYYDANNSTRLTSYYNARPIYYGLPSATATPTPTPTVTPTASCHKFYYPKSVDEDFMSSAPNALAYDDSLWFNDWYPGQSVRARFEIEKEQVKFIRFLHPPETWPYNAVWHIRVLGASGEVLSSYDSIFNHEPIAGFAFTDGNPPYVSAIEFSGNSTDFPAGWPEDVPYWVAIDAIQVEGCEPVNSGSCLNPGLHIQQPDEDVIDWDPGDGFKPINPADCRTVIPEVDIDISLLIYAIPPDWEISSWIPSSIGWDGWRFCPHWYQIPKLRLFSVTIPITALLDLYIVIRMYALIIKTWA